MRSDSRSLSGAPKTGSVRRVGVALRQRLPCKAVAQPSAGVRVIANSGSRRRKPRRARKARLDDVRGNRGAGLHCPLPGAVFRDEFWCEAAAARPGRACRRRRGQSTDEIGRRYLTKVPPAVTGSPGGRFVGSATAMGNAARERFARGVRHWLREGFAVGLRDAVSRKGYAARSREMVARRRYARGVVAVGGCARKAFGAVCQTNTAPRCVRGLQSKSFDRGGSLLLLSHAACPPSSHGTASMRTDYPSDSPVVAHG